MVFKKKSVLTDQNKTDKNCSCFEVKLYYLTIQMLIAFERMRSNKEIKSKLNIQLDFKNNNNK